MQSLIATGPLSLALLASSPDDLTALRHAYSVAISAVMIAGTVTIGMAIRMTLGIQHVNLVKVSRGRKESEQQEPLGEQEQSGGKVGNGKS